MERRRPLTGVRILDLTNLYTGPYCTMILAGLGAEIIQIERPGIGNLIRNNAPFVGPKGISMERKTPEDMTLIMLKRGRDKKSITLNLKTHKGKQIFKDLVKISDVVIENFTYGVMQRLGLAYEDLKPLNPGIVYCSITGFGHESLNRERGSYDIVGQAMSGFMAVTGSPDGPPMSAGILLGDALPAIFSALGIMAALYHKKQTGQGQKIDMAQRDCLLALICDEAFEIYEKIGLPLRVGNRTQRFAPYNAYETKDGYVVFGVVTEEQFQNLLRVIGREELIGDPRYASHPKRLKVVDELDEIILQWSRTKKKDEAVDALLQRKIPCGPVLEINELGNDPDLERRKMLVDLIHPTLGVIEGVKGPGFPIKLSECPHDFDQPAPYLGQHNEEIYGDLLGYDETAIEKLRNTKVIEQ